MLAGLVIFSILGFLSKELNVDIDHIAIKGQGLAFVTYPVALSLLPAAWFWSLAFFFMIFLLGLDTEFVAVETFVVSLTDTFPCLHKRKVSPHFKHYVTFYI